MDDCNSLPESALFARTNNDYFEQIVKVVLQEEDGVTDECKSNQVIIIIIIIIIIFCFVLSSYIYLHSLHYLNNI